MAQKEHFPVPVHFINIFTKYWHWLYNIYVTGVQFLDFSNLKTSQNISTTDKRFQITEALARGQSERPNFKANLVCMILFFSFAGLFSSLMLVMHFCDFIVCGLTTVLSAAFTTWPQHPIAWLRTYFIYPVILLCFCLAPSASLLFTVASLNDNLPMKSKGQRLCLDFF